MGKTDAYTVIEKEITALFEKPLTAQSVDLLYKLTNIRTNIKSAEYGAHNEPQGYSSNGKYDRNINELLDSYVLARKGGNNVEIVTSLEVLLVEISDLVVEIYNTARCSRERELITDYIRKMERH